MVIGEGAVSLPGIVAVAGRGVSQKIPNRQEIKYGGRKPQRPNLAKEIIAKILDTCTENRTMACSGRGDEQWTDASYLLAAPLTSGVILQ